MHVYVTQRRGGFYAVIYEGLDPVTGREVRRWHLGHGSIALTIETYQHVMPGRQADAARVYEALAKPAAISPVERRGNARRNRASTR